MRAVVSIAIVSALAAPAAASTYYVSADGSDSAAGTSTGAAWQSLTKVDAAALAPGDSVLFRAGDTFAGTLTLTHSGAAGMPITYGVYGTGARPIITGFVPVTGFTEGLANRWDAHVPGTLPSLAVVLVDGTLAPIARYPALTAANGGYLTVDSHSGTTSITDAALATEPDFTGAEIVIRKNHWILDRGTITGDVANTLTYTPIGNGGTYAPLDGFGYFIQNTASALSASGDWWYAAATQTLEIESPSEPTGVQVAAVASVLTATNASYLDVAGLAFTGATGDAVAFQGGNHITVEDCAIQYSGKDALVVHTATDVTVTGNTISDSLNDGVSITSGSTTGVVFSGNTIERTGTIAGMGASGDGTYVAFGISIDSTATIEGNTITDTGYIPITFQGNDLMIRHNRVDNFCLVKDDCGGIYTYDGGNPVTEYSGRVVEGNLVSNGVGAPLGTTAATGAADGIYLDNNSNGVDVKDNSVWHMANYGLYANSPENVTYTGNDVFDTFTSLGMSRYVDDGSQTVGGQDISGLTISNNVFVARTAAQRVFNYIDQALNFPATATLADRLMAIGTSDDNAFYHDDPLAFRMGYRLDKTMPFLNAPPLDRARWSTLTGFDTHSTEVPLVPTYTITDESATNLATNGSYDTDIVGTGGYSADAAHTIAWDGTSQLDGAGSLKLTTTSMLDADFTYLYGAIGPVTAGSQLILRFSLLGSNDLGIVHIALRQNESPYAEITAQQARPVAPGRTDYEAYLQPTVDDPSASWEISISQSAGTVYLDSIQVVTATVTAISPDHLFRFEYNATDAATHTTLDAAYEDATGTVYGTTLTLAPYSSVVLIRIGDVPPPDVGGDGGGDGGSGGGGGGSGGCCQSAPGGTPATLLLVGMVALVLTRRRRR